MRLSSTIPQTLLLNHSGWDIAKGDVHVTVAKLSEFKRFAEGHVNQENPSDIVSKELTASLIKADVDLLENNNYSPDDYCSFCN